METSGRGAWGLAGGVKLRVFGVLGGLRPRNPAPKGPIDDCRALAASRSFSAWRVFLTQAGQFLRRKNGSRAALIPADKSSRSIQGWEPNLTIGQIPSPCVPPPDSLVRRPLFQPCQKDLPTRPTILSP